MTDLKCFPAKKIVISLTACIVAFVFVLSMILSQQTSIISYAAPSKNVPDNFNLHLGKYNGEQAFITLEGGDTNFSMPTFFADENETIQLFALEYSKGSLDGEKYTVGSLVDDPGVLYILNRPYFYESLIGQSNYFKSFVIQAAIWDYFHAKYSDILEYPVDESYVGFITAMRVALGDGFLVYKNQVLNESEIDMLVVLSLIRAVFFYAQSAPEEVFNPTWSVIRESEEVVKTDDDKYYVLSIFEVVPDSDYTFLGYNVLLSGVEGAYIVDTDGKIIDTSQITPGTKFRVVVPVDKIVGVQNLEIEVSGNYNHVVANYYEPENSEHQRLIGVSSTVHSVVNESSVFSLELIGASDTSDDDSMHYADASDTSDDDSIHYADASDTSKDNSTYYVAVPDTSKDNSVYYIVVSASFIFVGFILLLVCLFKNKKGVFNN